MRGAESAGEYFIENISENIKSFNFGSSASKYKAFFKGYRYCTLAKGTLGTLSEPSGS